MGLLDFLKPQQAPAPLAEGMRRVRVVCFERDDGDVTTWQELSLDGKKVFQTWGRRRGKEPLGTESIGSRHETEAAAREALEAMVRERKRNFRRMTETHRDLPRSKWEALAPASSDAAQEAVLDAATGEAFDAAARVYADWLMSQGDPRGELASLLQHGRAPDEYLAVHPVALLGELDVLLGRDVSQLKWESGFLRGAGLKRGDLDSPLELEGLTKGFLALPVARFVNSLRFGLASFENDNDWGGTLKAVCESRRAPFMKELRFDDFERGESELSWAPFGDLSPYWARLPSLEHLTLRSGGGGTLGALELPKLETFVRESGGLGASELESIFSARWPRLRRLEVWFGDPGYGAEGDVGHVTPFLRGGFPPTLRTLGLRNCAFVSELLPVLFASPVLPQLEVLDLSMGVLGDGDVDALLGAAPQLKHLKVVDLSESLFSFDAVRRLQAALPQAQLADQREARGDARYVAVGE